MTIKLTEKAKENLERIAESRKKDSKFVRLEPGEKITLHFDPEKIEPVDVEFEGKKSIRYQYTVADPNEPEKPKYFTVS
jgi:Fe-S cluster assembly iron-binding protein IscA